MLSSPGPGRNRRFKIVDSDIVNFMETIDFKKTDESLCEVFGISYNTWRKITRREPVRYSLAKRLEYRISMMRGQPERSLTTLRIAVAAQAASPFTPD